MRTSTRLPPWARRDVVGYIFDAAKKRGGEARIVGGAVRDWLAGRRVGDIDMACLLYTSPSPRDATLSRMPSSA